MAAISNHFERRLYAAVDVADKERCRPDFAVPIYPGHLSLSAAEWDAKQGTRKFVIPGGEHPLIIDANLALNPDLHVSSKRDAVSSHNALKVQRRPAVKKVSTIPATLLSASRP